MPVTAMHMHYFTIEQREALERKLLARAEELRREIASADPRSPAEEATRAHALRELKYFEDTLQRIHAPDFGVCVDCGAEIPYVRLSANPIAKRCVACQAKHEHGGAAA